MKFTVLMPVFNTAPDNLFQAFYSIYNQTDISDYEILIVDDFSDRAETKSMLRHIGSYPRVKVIRLLENKGSGAARNIGIREINTEYVALMDSDDIAFHHRLRTQWNYIKKHKPDVLGCNLFSFYDHDMTRKYLFKSSHAEIPDYNDGWMVNQGTVIYRKEVVTNVGGYNEKLRRAQDIDLWKRIHKAGYKLRNITEIMYAWRRYKK